MDKRITNLKFSQNDSQFLNAVALANKIFGTDKILIRATKRQASKFRLGKGIVFKALKQGGE